VEFRRKTKAILTISTIFWLAAVAAGMRVILNYEYTPGAAAAPLSKWPPDTSVKREPGEATLVMLAHPQCPCTRASIGELARIMARCQGKLTARVLFYRPAGFEAEWAKTDLWRSAANIPGATAIADDDGAQARLFDATTSGQMLLYGRDGQLLFSGGITDARGHAGDNDGSDAIISFVNTGAAKVRTTSVFGCSLFDDKSRKN
jgi:hypothetical protein